MLTINISAIIVCFWYIYPVFFLNAATGPHQMYDVHSTHPGVHSGTVLHNATYNAT